MISSMSAPLIMFVIGAALCALLGHPELVGLGMMILAGLYRIIWGLEDIYFHVRKDD